jgi:hypothetical protein
MPGFKDFFKNIVGGGEEKESSVVTAEEEKQIKEGGEAVSELEKSMDLEKKAAEAMKGDKAERPEDKKE